jgi:hypothetical protein
MSIRNFDNDKNTSLPSDKSHLVEIVKMRTDSLVNYSNRVWKIFYWFQVFNLTILGAILTKQITDLIPVLFLGLTSLFLSFLWFFLGVNDFLSMEKHKTIKNYLEKDLYIQLDIEEKLQETVKKNLHKKLIKFNFNQTKVLFLAPVFNFISTIIVLLVTNFL